jgi:hypothetical protein
MRYYEIIKKISIEKFKRKYELNTMPADTVMNSLRPEGRYLKISP